MVMTVQYQLDARDRHRLSVDEYLLLDREGAFRDRRTELFDGEVYYMSPKHRPHARTVGDLYYKIRLALEASGSKLSVLTDISVRLTDHDVPEPDIAITDAPDGEGILPLESVKLLIEVADSTLARDMGLKAALYANAGVPEYWVVDIAGKIIHQMWAPGPEGYAERNEVAFGQRVAAEAIEALTLETKGL